MLLPSLPSRECGLKFSYIPSQKCSHIVTPFAGVWIEIPLCNRNGYKLWSLPSRECGLKSLRSCQPMSKVSHSLRGSVDWNSVVWLIPSSSVRHSLRGSVDWNIWIKSNTSPTISHSLRGSVDWNLKKKCRRTGSRWSLPSRECGLK